MKKNLRCTSLTTLLMLIASCKNIDTTQPEEARSLEELLRSKQSCDTSLSNLIQVFRHDKQPKLHFRYLSDADYTMIHSCLHAYSMKEAAQEITAIKLSNKTNAATVMDFLYKCIEVCIKSLLAQKAFPSSFEKKEATHGI